MHASALALVAALAGAALGAVPAAPQTAFRQAPVAALRTTPPPQGEFPQDPAHALYREGREALNNDDFERAARLFQQVRQRHPRS